MRHDRGNGAYGAVKFLIIGGCVGVLVVLALVAIPVQAKRHSARTKCAQNLKDIDMAALIWVNDHATYMFPWHVPSRDGGVSEIAMSGDVSAIFRCLSNQFKYSMVRRSADVLTCPADTEQKSESG